ncbi:MAG: hypothetical protein ONB16_01580 [candidate division KSB1 bacterium]|nr:hypothetical protein [candidate division KSB1 bacterium]MDZ7319611.1 hypothetical protein [candidate division KSB1 bacterium]MDZ7342614.1 hypothetical protein [candidate division KSB1 bacterium]
MKHLKFGIGLFALSAWLLSHCTLQNPVSTQTTRSKSIKHRTDIVANEIWRADSTHIVAASVAIRNATLRIQPGTKIQFEKDAALLVMGNGGLIANGTVQPIIFTRDSIQKQTWNYIYFGSDAQDDSCQLINCLIEFGGGDSTRRSLVYCDNARPTIIGCRISKSASSGVSFVGDCRGMVCHSNVIDSCRFVAIETHATNVSSLGLNTIRDNGLNQIRITTGDIDFNDTWRPLSVPYRMADGLQIRRAALTIEPAVELIFESQEGATVADNGRLYAVGTPSEQIVFTASDIGLWRGLKFKATANDMQSRLSYCILENGGQDSNAPANLILENTSPEISNCLIHQSLGYGVYISGQFNAGAFANNRITRNALAPFSVPANGVPNFPGNQYFGNGQDVIEIRGNNIETAIRNGTLWEKQSLPYNIKGRIMIQASTLTVAPGVQILMSPSSALEVLTAGGLIADGTAEPIAITGAQTTAGYWHSIYFSPTADADQCQLINCRISYGGGDISRPGMIYCDNISPIIRNCVIEFSQTWGIYLSGSASIASLSGNVFQNNGYGNYFKQP